MPPFPCMSRPFIPCYAISNAIEGMLFSRFMRGLTFIGGWGLGRREKWFAAKCKMSQTFFSFLDAHRDVLSKFIFGKLIDK